MPLVGPISAAFFAAPLPVKKWLRATFLRFGEKLTTVTPAWYDVEKEDVTMQLIRIYDMPPCRMIASPVGMFGEPALDAFDAWMNAQPRTMFPRDFLTWDDSDPPHPWFRWYYQYEVGMTLPAGAEVVDFPGGMYAVATGIDQQTDKAAMDAKVADFLLMNGLERDPGRRELGNIITSPAVKAELGCEQMDYYYPVRKAADATLVQYAAVIARRAHAKQVDKSGKPYIGHIERVAARVESDEAKCVALLHDVLEDADILPEAEMRRIFGDAIADGVLSVTRREGESYEAFVRRAGENPLGRQVKIADLIDNSNLSRLDRVTITDVQRQRKYNDALMYLLSLK